MVHNYTIKPSKKIQKVCEPLRLHLGVSHFWYSRTTKDGKFISIASNPEMHDFYYSSELYQYSPFFHHPDVIKPGIYTYRNTGDQQFQNTIDKCSQSIGVELGIGIVFKEKGELIRFGYATDPKNSPQFHDSIVNNLSILKKFNSYFLKEIQDILRNAYMVDLPSIIGSAYYSIPEGMNVQPSNKALCAFLQDIGAIHLTDLKRLSKREKECLKFLKDTLSAFQIGCRMKISERTVEKNMESIKNKLTCNSKKELVEMASLLDVAGYFDA